MSVCHQSHARRLAAMATSYAQKMVHIWRQSRAAGETRRTPLQRQTLSIVADYRENLIQQTEGEAT